MYTDKPGEEAPDSVQTPKASALRHYVIGLMIHVSALVLLQAFGLHGIAPHIITVAICQWVDLMRQSNG